MIDISPYQIVKYGKFRYSIYSCIHYLLNQSRYKYIFFLFFFIVFLFIITDMENIMNYDYTKDTPHIISILTAINMLIES